VEYTRDHSIRLQLDVMLQSCRQVQSGLFVLESYTPLKELSKRLGELQQQIRVELENALGSLPPDLSSGPYLMPCTGPSKEKNGMRGDIIGSN